MDTAAEICEGKLKAVSYTHLDVYKRQVKDFAKKELDSGELVELQLKERLPKRQFLVASGVKGGQSLAAAELLKLLTDSEEKG